jgi:hypothetical protein
MFRQEIASYPYGADIGEIPGVIDGIWPRKSGSHQTPRWTAADSNRRSLSQKRAGVSGRGPPAMQYPRVVTNSDGAGVIGS